MNALVTDINDLSDEQLVVLAREKNEEAFTQLVSRCTGMLKALSAKFYPDSPEAEDLLQEGLLGLHAAVQTYRPSAAVAFRTYAYTCARNRMISALRHRNDVSTAPLDDGEEPSVTLLDDDPAVMLVRQEELQQLFERLKQKLSPLEYRVLVDLLGGYSYREVAKRLNVSEKAVDNARQRLRRKLGPLFF